jgi:hypothetical protein
MGLGVVFAEGHLGPLDGDGVIGGSGFSHGSKTGDGCDLALFGRSPRVVQVDRSCW